MKTRQLGYRNATARFALVFMLGALALAALIIVAHPASAQSASQVKFITQPYNVAAGDAFVPALKVGVYDSSNNLVTSSTATITLTLQAPQSPSACPGTFGGLTRPCGRLLYGASSGQQAAIQATAASGIATFADGLRLDALGKGYRIQASASGLTSATSVYFDVTSGPAWPQFRKDPAHQGSIFSNAAITSVTTLADFSVSAAGQPVVAGPLLADLDRNGLMDVLTVDDVPGTAGQLTVQAFLQTSPGTFGSTLSYAIPLPANTQCTTGCANAHAVLAVGNLDSDNVPEVVVYSAQWVTFSEPVPGAWSVAPNSALLDMFNVRVLSNSLGLLAEYRLTVPTTNLVPPVIDDLDGDGTNEVVILASTTTGTYPDTVRIFTYSSGALTSAAAATYTLPLVSYSNGPATQCNNGYGMMTAAPAVAEFRSGHAGREILVGTNSAAMPFPCQPGPATAMATGRLYLCEYSSGSLGCPSSLVLPKVITTANNDEALGHSPQVVGLAAADLTGDGVLEAVVNARHRNGDTVQSDTLEIISMATTGTPAMTLGASQNVGYVWNTAALGDVDLDGKPDIGLVKYASDPGNTAKAGDVMVRGYNGGIVDKGRLARPAPSGGSSEGQGGGALMDMDRDGKMEFVFGSADGDLVATTGGAAGPVNPTLLWSATMSGIPITPPALGDLTGDCRPEILVGMDNGKAGGVQGATATTPGTPSISAITGPPFASPGSGKQAKLFWSTPADGGLPILSYRVYRATSSTGTYNEVGVWRGATSPVSGGEFVDDLSAVGYGDYYYKVTAVNCLGESPKSSEFYAEVKLAQAPSGLLGVVGDTTTPAHKVLLTWNASAANVARPNGCGPVDEYWVFRGTTSTFTPNTTSFANRIGVVANGIAVPPTTFNFTDTSPTVQTDGDYYYKVIAKNCVGNSTALGPFWAEVKVAQDPSGLAVTVVQTPLTARLAWSSPVSNSATPNGCGAVLRYNLYRASNAQAGPFGPTPIATVTAPVTTYNDTDVATGEHYYYKVAAVNCVGSSASVPSGNGVLADFKPPAAPSLTATGMTSATINLAWTNPGDPASDGAGVGIAKYEVYWALGPSTVTTSDTKMTPDPAASATALTHSGRTVNQQVCYAIRAIDGNGNTGSLSTTACASAPDTTVPSTVTDLAASPGSSTRIDLAWTAATDNVALTGYDLYWKVGPGVTTASALFSPAPGSSAVSLVDATVSPGTQYCYRIRAVDAVGNKAPLSNEACATTLNPSAVPPGFVLGSLAPVLEDAGTVTIAGFATSIVPGSAAPSGVGAKFTASVVTNAALFATPPAIAPSAGFAVAPWSGTLTFRPAANACGSADVEVYLMDNGGATGRVDTSPIQTFTITVTCVNDAPVFTAGTTVYSIGPNSPPIDVLPWATGISPGPANEAGQQLRFTVTPTNPGLFATAPVVDPSATQPAPWPGNLHFAPAAGAYGVSILTVCLVDDGGAANGGVNSACVPVTVRVDGPPTAYPDCYATSGRITVAAPGVGGNDRTFSGAPPGVELVSPPRNAQVFQLHPDGSFEYVPQGGFAGQDSFTYRALAGPFRSDPAQVCIDVLPSGSASPPSAMFSVGSPAVAGMPLAFMDQSSDMDGAVVAWAWSFGDAGQESTRSASHAYDKPGIYRASLTVQDDSGLSDTHAVDIVVLPASVEPALLEAEVAGDEATSGSGTGGAGPGGGPVADDEEEADAPALKAPVIDTFTVAALPGTAGRGWSFQATELGGLGYAWDFGDGSPPATGRLVSHTYAEPKQYVVKLTFVADGQPHGSSQKVDVVAAEAATRDVAQGAGGAQVAAESGATMPPLAWAGLGAAALLVVAGPAVYLMLRRKAKAPEPAPEGLVDSTSPEPV